MRNGALVKKQLPDGRWIYGRYHAGPPSSSERPYVDVMKDQGWWVEGETPYKVYRDDNINGWRDEVYNDPMYLREAVLDVFERAKIGVVDISCPENKTEEIDELWVEDEDRTRVFMEVYNLIMAWKPKISRQDLVIVATIESPKKA